MRSRNLKSSSDPFFQTILGSQFGRCFGNISGFVNGNMFAGLFGEDLFVRLSEDKRDDLLKNKGARLLEPMAGKPMKDYVVIPRACIPKHF